MDGSKRLTNSREHKDQTNDDKDKLPPMNKSKLTTNMTIVQIHATTGKPEVLEPLSPTSINEFPNHELVSSMKNKLKALGTKESESFIPSPLRSTKTVRFSPTAIVKDTLSRHDMSFMERCNYWMQGHEFLAIRRRNEAMNQAMDEIDDLMRQMSRREVTIDNDDPCANETGPREKNKQFGKRGAVREDLCGMYCSETFEDDPFGGIYFDGKIR